MMIRKIGVILYGICFSCSCLAWNPPRSEDLTDPEFLKYITLDSTGRWSDYVPSTHGMLTQRTLELLFETNPEAAVLLSDHDTFLKMLEGVRMADNAGADVFLYVQGCVRLLFCEVDCYTVKIEDSRLFNTSSYTHFQPALDLRFWNALEWLTDKSPYTPIMDPIVDNLVDCILSFIGIPTGRLGSIKLHAFTQPDIERHHKSAEETIGFFYDHAIEVYQTGIDSGQPENAWLGAVFYLGWALHLVQDMGVPFHVYGECCIGHEAFENFAEDFRDWGDIFSDNSEAYDSLCTPENYITNAANETRKRVEDLTDANRYNKIKKILTPYQFPVTSAIISQIEIPFYAHRKYWNDEIRIGFQVAQKYGCGLIMKFLKDIEEIPTPLRGSIREYITDAHGTRRSRPLADACIFYRRADAYKGKWQLARSDSEGRYSIPLRRGRQYLIRPAMPGFRFVDHRLRPQGPFMHEHFHEIGEQVEEHDFHFVRRPEFDIRRWYEASSRENVFSTEVLDEGQEEVILRGLKKSLIAESDSHILSVSKKPMYGLQSNSDIRLFMSYPFNLEFQPILKRQVYVDLTKQIHGIENEWEMMVDPSAYHTLTDIQGQKVQPVTSSQVQLQQGATQSDTAQHSIAISAKSPMPSPVHSSAEGPQDSLSSEDREKKYIAFMEKLKGIFPHKQFTDAEGKVVCEITITPQLDNTESPQNAIVMVPIDSNVIIYGGGKFEMQSTDVTVEAEIIPGPGYIDAPYIDPVTLPIEDYGEKCLQVYAGTEAGLLRIRFTISVRDSEIIKDLTRDLVIQVQPSLTFKDTKAMPISPKLKPYKHDL